MSSGYIHTGDCVYLSDRRWALRMLPAPQNDDTYRALLDSCHRRSGWVIYRPVCRGCTACQPIRVPVAKFAPSKSQRRALRRNADLTLDIGPPEPTEEKLALHNRFVETRFERGEAGFPSLESYAEVFGPSPVTTREMRFRDASGRLIGLGLVDLLPDVVSSVYFYFDPDESKRSLGTFSALQEIELARSTGRTYLYLGYYIAGCREMNYKNRFRPCEVLNADGAWEPAPAPSRDLPRAATGDGP